MATVFNRSFALRDRGNLYKINSNVWFSSKNEWGNKVRHCKAKTPKNQIILKSSLYNSNSVPSNPEALARDFNFFICFFVSDVSAVGFDFNAWNGRWLTIRSRASSGHLRALRSASFLSGITLMRFMLVKATVPVLPAKSRRTFWTLSWQTDLRS